MSIMAALAATANTMIGSAVSVYQMVEGRRMMNKAMEEMRRYERQPLTNVFKDIDVSTTAQDIQTEETARNTATQVDTLSKAGARGVVGGAEMVMRSNQEALRRIGAQLEEKYQQRDILIAQDEARIRQMKERREEMDIEGLATLYGTGYAEKMKGLESLTKSLSAGASAAPELFGDVNFGEGRSEDKEETE